MIRSLLRVAFMLVVCIVGYNYFLGTPSEKDTSKKIVGQGKDLFNSVRDLVRTERDKYDEGKYDKAITGVKDVFGKIRETADNNKGILDDLDKLEVRRKQLEQDLKDINDMTTNAKEGKSSEFTERGGKPTALPKPKIGEPKPKTETLDQKKKRLQDELHNLLDSTDALMDKAAK